METKVLLKMLAGNYFILVEEGVCSCWSSERPDREVKKLGGQ